MSQPKYNFYATLLDAFFWYKKSESESADQDLIDKINRVPVTDPVILNRMNKGTAFNDLVDGILLGKIDIEDPSAPSIDGFVFDIDIVKEVASYLQGSFCQHRVEKSILVNGSEVVIYGYNDYLLLNKAIDLKTTSSYDLGKYKDSMQMHIYPVCLISSGILIDEFEFLVTDFKSVFKEPYKINYEESLSKVSECCAGLMEFIQSNKEKITDSKILIQ